MVSFPLEAVDCVCGGRGGGREKRALRMSVKVLRIAMAQGEWSFPSHPRDSIGREAVGVFRMLKARPLGGPQALLERGRVLRPYQEEREFGINLGSERQPSTLTGGVGERDFPWGVWRS